jgi:hypothetical protein
MRGRKRTAVKFYIRAREPMDAEVSEALDTFAAESGCDRSGAARHLILLGKRFRVEHDRQVVMGQLSQLKVPSLVNSSAPSRGHWESSITTKSEANIAAAPENPSSLPVTEANRGPQISCQSEPPTERPGDDQPAKSCSPEELPRKRLDMTKLRFRS